MANMATATQAVPGVVGGQPEDLPQRAGAAAACGSGGGSVLSGSGGHERASPSVRRSVPARPTTTPAATGAGARHAGRWPAARAKRARPRSGPASTHRAVGEHDDLVAAAHRGQPVRDDDADAAAQQPVGGPLHPRLGDRVDPGGRLVEDHHVRVADQDPGERDQLLLPGGQHVAAVAELGVACRPAGRRPRTVRPSSSSARRGRGEQVAGRTARCSRPACRPGSRCAAARRRSTGAAPPRRGRAGRCRRGRPCRGARRRPGSAPWPASTCPSRCARSARRTGRGRTSG